MATDSVPETETNRRRRVLEICDTLAEMFGAGAAHYDELQELGVDVPTFYQLMASRLPKASLDAMAEVAKHGMSPEVIEATVAAIRERRMNEEEPMRALIARLFAEAPKMTDAGGKPVADQSPALECFVVLRFTGAPLKGILSVTPEGTLKLLQATAVKEIDPNTRREIVRDALFEHFFEYEDVVMVVVERPVTSATSSIFTSS